MCMTVDSRCACRAPSWVLCHSRGYCSVSSCSVHLVGNLRCFLHAISPASSRAASRLPRLGNSHGAASVDVSLTLLENWFEEQAGVQPYQGGFLLHYLDRLVYPNISSSTLTIAGATVCGLNLAFYVWQIWTAAGTHGQS